MAGIGYFEILSDRMTSPQDIGQNFFLTPDSLGKPLADETTNYLRELNPGVEGKGKVAVSVRLFVRVCMRSEIT